MKKVRVLFPDLNGCLRGKYIPEDKFKDGATYRMPRSVMSQDIEGEEVSDLADFAPESKDRDLQIIPDMSTKVEIPGSTSSLHVMADVAEPGKDELSISPRTILKKAQAELAKAGYEMKVATELEFYITHADGSYFTTADIVRPYGDVNAFQALDIVVDDILVATKSIGLTPESVLNEAGPAQLEINFEPLSPLEIADKTSFFKQSVRDIASRHGYAATFLAKPLVHDVSSSQHVHISLWKDGQNVFDSDAKLLEAFLAGQVKYAHDTFALMCPNPNSFRRFTLQQGYIPTHPTWGEDDRRAAYRLTGDKGNRHFEHRVPGADANVYLIISAMIFSGLAGIKEGLTTKSDDVKKALDTAFEDNLNDTLRDLNNSKFCKDAFGQDFVTLYTGIKKSELFKFHKQITDWERRLFGTQV